MKFLHQLPENPIWNLRFKLVVIHIREIFALSFIRIRKYSLYLCTMSWPTCFGTLSSTNQQCWLGQGTPNISELPFSLHQTQWYPRLFLSCSRVLFLSLFFISFLMSTHKIIFRATFLTFQKVLEKPADKMWIHQIFKKIKKKRQKPHPLLQ